MFQIAGGVCPICRGLYTSTFIYCNLGRDVYIVIFGHPDGRACATDRIGVARGDYWAYAWVDDRAGLPTRMGQ